MLMLLCTPDFFVTTTLIDSNLNYYCGMCWELAMHGIGGFIVFCKLRDLWEEILKQNARFSALY
jgi:hypothetical protein